MIDRRWWRQGRPATRGEVVESIDSGMPILTEIAEQDGPAALTQLAAARGAIDALLPARDPRLAVLAHLAGTAASRAAADAPPDCS